MYEISVKAELHSYPTRPKDIHHENLEIESFTAHSQLCTAPRARAREDPFETEMGRCSQLLLLSLFSERLALTEASDNRLQLTAASDTPSRRQRPADAPPPKKQKRRKKKGKPTNVSLAVAAATEFKQWNREMQKYTKQMNDIEAYLAVKAKQKHVRESASASKMRLHKYADLVAKVGPIRSMLLASLAVLALCACALRFLSRSSLLTLFYTALYLTASPAAILINKVIMKDFGFHYPIIVSARCPPEIIRDHPRVPSSLTGWQS